MIAQIAHILYFLITAILIGILFLHNIVAHKSTFEIGENSIYLFTLVLAPLAVQVLKSIFPKIHIQKMGFHVFSQWKHITTLIFLVWGIYFFTKDVQITLYSSFFLLSLVLSVDSRLSFFIAFVLFVYVAFFLWVSNQDMAEKLSVHAYYFLVLWVLIEIAQSFILPKISKLWKK